MYQAIQEKFRQLKRKSLVGQLVILLLSVELLFFSSFTGFVLPTVTKNNLTNFAHNQALRVLAYCPARWQSQAQKRLPQLTRPAKSVRFSLYVPQTPAAIFVGYILGSFWGPLALLLFLVIGLLGPRLGIYAFAAGGGQYFHQPSFGYLLGLVLASWCVGKLTSKRPTSFRQLLAIGSGLLAVHVTGLAYLLGVCLFAGLTEGSHALPVEWQPWLFEEIRNLSWYALLYDLVFSLLLVGAGFPFRWLVNNLTAPDLTLKTKQSPPVQEPV